MKGKSKTIIISIIGTIISIAVVSLGVTYAFFTANITGSENVSTIVAEAGIMKISVSGGSSITAANIMPDSANPWGTKTITLTGTNTTKKNMSYKMKLAVDNNEFKKANMQYTLTSSGSNGVVISSVSTATNITAAAGATQVLGGTTQVGYFSNATNVVHTYVLKLFYPETNTDQSEDMSAKFAAHIVVESVNS
jgi:hypothetical protein